MLAEQFQTLIKLVAVSHNRPAFSCRHGFHRMEAEGCHIRNGTRGLSVIERSDRMGAVRDQNKLMFITDFPQGL